jgi:cysteinyl-tRNA synthetase
MFTLTAHYSSPVTYSDESMAAAAAGWERLFNAVRLTRQMLPSASEGDEGNGILARLDAARATFRDSMDDDFNAPKAIAGLQDLTREVNSLLNSEVKVGRNVLQVIEQTYGDLGGTVLGLIPAAEKAQSDGKRESGLIELLIDLRKRARAAKNYAESDRIRDELAALGVILEDRPDGTIWKLS